MIVKSTVRATSGRHRRRRLDDDERRPCSVCPNPQDTISLPEKEISFLPGHLSFIKSCATLDQIVPSVLKSTSKTCRLIQSLGTYCGCPRDKNACVLCGEQEAAGEFAATGDNATTIMTAAVLGFPQREVPVFSNAFDGITPNCEVLEAWFHSKDGNSSTCLTGRKILASYCGCQHSSDNNNNNSPPNMNIFDRQEKCNFCQQGNSKQTEILAYPDKKIDTLLPGLQLETCQEHFDAAKLLLPAEGDMCHSLQQSVLGSVCGCPSSSSSISTPSTTALTQPSPSTITTTEQNSSNKTTTACSLCSDGSSVPYPNQTLPRFQKVFGFLPTCEIAESFARSFDVDSKECDFIQLTGEFCSCPRKNNSCTFCAGEELQDSFRNRPLLHLANIVDGFTPTCSDFIKMQYQLDASEKLCRKALARDHLCGCGGGVNDYWGADTLPKHIALAWVPRVSAILSLLGSICVLMNLLMAKKKRWHIYKQLVFGITIFDIFTAGGWSLSTYPIPERDQFGETWAIYGASGSNAACTAQGFIIHLGQTSIFYNASLSLYYMLVSVRSWRDEDFKKITLWLHVCPILLGFGLAFAGIPSYYVVYFGCYIPPSQGTKTVPYYLIFLPIFTVIAFATTMIAMVYCKVRLQNRKSNQWRFGTAMMRNNNNNNAVGEGSNTSSSSSSSSRPRWWRRRRHQKRQRTTSEPWIVLEREVFWQSCFYLAAFYVTWIWMLVAVGARKKLDDQYWFWITLVFLTPIQGFSNAIVFFRPKLVRWLRAQQVKKEKRSRNKNNNDQSPDGPHVMQPLEEFQQQQNVPEAPNRSREWEWSAYEDEADPSVDITSMPRTSSGNDENVQE